MANNLPALGGDEALGMAVAQVVTVRLGGVTERTENGHGVRVHVGEGRNGFTIAGDLAAGATT